MAWEESVLVRPQVRKGLYLVGRLQRGNRRKEKRTLPVGVKMK